MKRFFSILSLVIVLTMAVSLIGCGGTTEDPDVEGIDFCGEEIVIVCFWDDVPEDEGVTLADQRWYQRYKELEEKYNCVFTCNVMVETEIAAQFVAANLAGDKFGDIIFFRMEQAKQYQKDGVLYDVSKIFDMDAEYLNKDVTEMFTDPETGAVYAFSNYNSGQHCFLVFNKDIFDRYGIEYPYEYVKNNTWTPEKFLEIATRATNETEGVKGFYGITTDTYISYFIHGFGGTICYIDENGLYQSGLLKKETIEGLEFIRDMNTKHGVTHIPDIGVAWTDPVTQFMAGKVAMTYAGDFQLTDMAANMEDDFGIVPYPKKPEISDWVNMSESHIVRVIQANMDDDYAKNLGVVYGEYMEPLATPEEQAELDRDKFESWCRDQESVEMLELLNTFPVRSVHQIVASPSVYYNLVYGDLELAMRGDENLITILEKDNPVFQLDLDATNAGTEYEYIPEWEEEGEEEAQ